MSAHTCEHSIIRRRAGPRAGQTCRDPSRRWPSSPLPQTACTGRGQFPKPVCHNENRRSRCDGTGPGPCACLRLFTVRAMLRDGMDPAVVAAVTGVPRAPVDLILTLDLDRQ